MEKYKKENSHHASLGMRSNFHCENPKVLFAIIILALNDHVLKSTVLAGFVTGKLSDFAGIFCFPFFLLDIFSILKQGCAKSRQVFYWCLLLTLILFVSLKTNFYVLDFFKVIYCYFGYEFKITQDLGDLISLVMLPIALLHFNSTKRDFDELQKDA